MKPPFNDFFCGESHSVIANHRRIFFRVRTNPRIKRSRLMISPEEGLVVETPRRAKLAAIREIVFKRQDWVLESLKEIREQYDRARTIKRHKNSVLIFGKEKKICRESVQSIIQIQPHKNTNFLWRFKCFGTESLSSLLSFSAMGISKSN